MEITEQAIRLLAKVATEVQARFTDFSDLAHGWEHVHRVYHLALHLAEQRIAFLRLYLQELQQELAEGGYGYDMPEEVTYRLLWDEKKAEEQKQEQPVEELQRGKVVAIHRIFEEQHSA